MTDSPADGGVSTHVVKCVTTSELCNLLQLRQTERGRTGCQDNDPSLSEAESLGEEVQRTLLSALITVSGCSHMILLNNVPGLSPSEPGTTEDMMSSFVSKPPPNRLL